MNILSLFDGISCARVALDRADIKVDKYYSSEIDRYALQIAQKNYPDTIQVGDIKELGKNIPYPQELLNGGCDLMIFGSPCTDLSIAKKDRQGLKGNASGLFYEAVRIIKEIKPKYFILENVNSMPKEAKAEITKQLWDIEPTMINAALVSAQNRKRLFWVGKLNGDKYEKVEIPQPEDKGILLKDVLEEGLVDREKSYAIDACYFKGANWEQYKNKSIRQLVISDNGEEKTKSNTIRTSSRGSGVNDKHTISKSSWEHNNKLVENSIIRKLTPIECERLMTLPDRWTEGVSNSQRYKMLGNGFVVDVVTHILKKLIL